jgi:hypothetical protein
MIRTILTAVFIMFVIGLLLFWLLSGGVSRAWQAGKDFTNPIAVMFGGGSTTQELISLPWRPDTTRGPDISGYVGVADQQLQGGGAVGQQQTQDDNTARLQQFGNPSPYRGVVTISSVSASNDPSHEYVQLQSSGDAAGPLNISGWMLQSVVSGRLGVLPYAAPIYAGGTVNSVQQVALMPGGSVTVTSAVSPVGVSFQETKCTGYLDQVQSFYPALSEACPAPADTLPQTAQNLRTYGASCFDYLDSLQACSFVGAGLPSNLSSACRTYIATSLSYNGCVNMYRGGSDFAQRSWRLYLNQQSPLWNPLHDIVRLLDEQGRVVDVYTY